MGVTCLTLRIAATLKIVRRMFEDWRKTTLLLGLYGLFKEIRPIEPFLNEYMTSNRTGVTPDEVYQDIYPVWTYSYLCVLVLVFLVLEGFAYILTWVLLTWARGLFAMQMMQVAYGVATSTEVAYFTYIYARVPGDQYQKVTSFTRAALLFGRFLSGVLSQVLVGFGLTEVLELNYTSLAMVTMATLVSFLLPSVTNTIYFHRDTSGVSDVQGSECDSISTLEKCRKALLLLKRDFVNSFSNLYILKWSLWWALATCGNFQVGNYTQALWDEIRPEAEVGELYNGAVEATATLLGAVLALILGFAKFNWSIIGDLSLAVICLLDAVVLYLMGASHSIWMGYAGYIVFRSLYQMTITVASFEVARRISETSYGLVFGFNTFLALGLQTILTTIVASSAGLALSPPAS